MPQFEDDWVEIEDASPDDWVTVEECDCARCSARMNPRGARGRRSASEYADLESIEEVVEEALNKHGLTMGLGHVTVAITRGGKSRAGACSYSRSRHQCRIMLNGLAWPAFTAEQRLNTILHETAHAIQFLTMKFSDHGPAWKKIAKSIGCSGDRCTTVEESQAILDAYAEARGLPKSKVLTKEVIEEARERFAVGDYVRFEHNKETHYGKITKKAPTRAAVFVAPFRRANGEILAGTFQVPYPLLRPATREAFVASVVDAPEARAFIAQAKMTREDFLPTKPPPPPPPGRKKVAGVDKPFPGERLSDWQARTGRRPAPPPAPRGESPDRRLGESLAEWQERTGRTVWRNPAYDGDDGDDDYFYDED